MYQEMNKTERKDFSKTKQFLESLGFTMRQAGGRMMTVPDSATASFCIDLDNQREMVVSSLGSPYGPYSMDEAIGVEFWLVQGDDWEQLPAERLSLPNVRELEALVGQGKRYQPLSS